MTTEWHKKYHRKWYLKNRKKRLKECRAYNKRRRKIPSVKKRIANYAARYRKGRKKYFSCQHKAWVKANPRRVKELLRRHLYGIEPEEFKYLMRKQKSKCAICRKRLKPPHVDHCHMTDKIRGLLCQLCNQGLGFFRDSKKNLLRAIRYLSR